MDALVAQVARRDSRRDRMMGVGNKNGRTNTLSEGTGKAEYQTDV